MKNNKKILLLTAYVILSVLGLVFLCLAIFTKDENNTYLCVSLGSLIVANILNFIRDLGNRKK